MRLVTYNIHKGVQGLWPAKRLEIHNLRQAVEQFDADIVCLQEVREYHHAEARRFAHWPASPQSDFLSPRGYHSVYRTNAVTRSGAHGNALLSRWPVVRHQHQDMSDHRLEQRGLLHVELQVEERVLHVVVVHLGLIRASRKRQLVQLGAFIAREVPGKQPLVIAGDFNEWDAHYLAALEGLGLHSVNALAGCGTTATFPARLPLLQFDYLLVRGLQPVHVEVPAGRTWWRMSDHLPLVADCVWSDTPPCH